MKKYINIILLFIFFLDSFMRAEPTIHKNQLQSIYRSNGILSNLEIPPLKFQIPEIQEIPISNSETLYLYPDDTLPIINLSFIIEGGTFQESDEERGLYSILLELWEEGGANGKSGEEISKELANLGAEIHFSLTREYISIRFICLKQNFPRAFSILKDIILKPEFSKEQLEIIRLQYIDAIQRRNDKPEQIASRKISEIIHYPHKIEESITREDIQKINRDMIIGAYRHILSHRRMHIALEGDIQNIDYRTLFQQLSKEMGKVHSPFTIQNLSYNIPGKLDLKNTIILVEKNIPQAIIVLATKVPPYHSPDTFPLQVGNYILGGGSFVSKMMREIRVQRGLAYYSYSSVRFNFHSGKFIAVSGTNFQQTQESLQIMLELIQNFSQLITEDDIKIAKDAIINSHIFQFSNPSKLLYHYILIHKIYGFPKNFLEIYPDKIQNVSKENIIRTFKKYIQSQNLWILIVGPKELKSALAKLKKEILLIEPETSIHSIP